MSRNSAAAPRKDPKTGTWYFIVDIGTGPDGQRRQAKRRGFSTKKEAQEALDDLRKSLRTATYVPPKRQTVKEFLEVDWLPAVRRQLAPSTWESYTAMSSCTSPHGSAASNSATSTEPHSTGSTPTCSTAAGNSAISPLGSSRAP